MVTEEQMNKTFEEIDKIREEFAKQQQLNENTITPNFKSIEEVRAFYHCEPFDEFNKRFRSGN